MFDFTESSFALISKLVSDWWYSESSGSLGLLIIKLNSSSEYISDLRVFIINLSSIVIPNSVWSDERILLHEKNYNSSYHIHDKEL